MFGREDEADIGVFFETVEVVLPTLIQRDHVAAQTGLVERFLFDFRSHGAPGEKGLLGCHFRFDCGVDAAGDVFDAHEHVEFEVEASFLLRGRPGVEALTQIIVILVAELLQGVGADMMVGNDQAVLGHERAGAAAVETHGRLLDVLEPRVRQVKAVFLLELFAGRTVEQPHAFVRAERV